MTSPLPITITAISGSVRKQSSNKDILTYIAAQFPEYVTICFYKELEALPHFNPDIDTEQAPESVQRLRSILHQSDAVIICTPEYAFGVPGVLKNALDWLVSSGEMNTKPTAAITASPLTSGGDKAMASLVHTLTALGTIRNEAVTLCIPAVKKVIDSEGVITDPNIQKALKNVSVELLKLVDNNETPY